MYSANNNFESDLINSYAWDTAILFLQEYDNRTDAVKGNSNYKEKYSIQGLLSSGLKDTGTNAPNIADANKDKICNVYDMAENCLELTTETFSDYDCPCVGRGGAGNESTCYTSYRYNEGTTSAYDALSFMPILYIK